MTILVVFLYRFCIKYVKRLALLNQRSCHVQGKTMFLKIRWNVLHLTCHMQQTIAMPFLPSDGH